MEENIDIKIHKYSLEEIMGERFSRYAKSIIQDRAIPDVRDGLKPVQRRILYGMYHDHNTYDKPYRKSAKTVGIVMGNYHPHGDSSIYEAMVRMSQWWKQNVCYIDMHGNNGSMDGDAAAAMRYTECRLTKLANELLKDIDKKTVTWSPNFDDTEMEPTVLPVKFPLLLVNGASGIAAGYATNIPPHNLGEVIDATIFRIDNPNSRVDTIMKYIKGPDFPTGGICEGISGIKDAFNTGKGKVIIRAKAEIKKKQIIIYEIPFDVNKANLVKKIDEIRINKKIEGILEVRDETDREGLQIVIELKKDANSELVLNYLYKNTDLQITYNYNMVAIANKCPKELGVLDIIDASIAFQKEIIVNRTNFDLQVFKHEMHITEGLIKVISILDEVIKTIRASINKSDAKNNLVKQFNFSEIQAEAIVTLQLYRLTNTDVKQLQEKLTNLEIIINSLQAILDDPKKLEDVMKQELKNIKKNYGVERKTIISEEILDIKIDTTDLISKEDVMVCVTKDGYVKKTSLRSYSTSSEIGLKELDYPIGIYNINTMQHILLFTNLGNYILVPIHLLPDAKWKDLGKHISNIVSISTNEKIIKSIPVYDFDDTNILLATKLGMGKLTKLKDFKVSRYNKTYTAIKLKANDELVTAEIAKSNVVVITKRGKALLYDTLELPIVSTSGSGSKTINLKMDEVVKILTFSEHEYLLLATSNKTMKRIKINNIPKSKRTLKGTTIIRDVKTNPYYIANASLIYTNDEIGLINEDIKYIKVTEVPILDLLSTGSSFKYNDIFVKFSNKKEDKPSLSLEEIDNKIMTIDDLLEI